MSFQLYQCYMQQIYSHHYHEYGKFASHHSAYKFQYTMTWCTCDTCSTDKCYVAGLERTHHVYEVSGVVYNAVLGMVDIQRGSNSYYKLQILESDAKSRYGTAQAQCHTRS